MKTCPDRSRICGRKAQNMWPKHADMCPKSTEYVAEKLGTKNTGFVAEFRAAGFLPVPLFSIRCRCPELTVPCFYWHGPCVLPCVNTLFIISIRTIPLPSWAFCAVSLNTWVVHSKLQPAGVCDRNGPQIGLVLDGCSCSGNRWDGFIAPVTSLIFQRDAIDRRPLLQVDSLRRDPEFKVSTQVIQRYSYFVSP